MPVQNQLSQQGCLNEEYLKNVIFNFLTFNGHPSQEAIDSIEGILLSGPSVLDFLGRRIISQRESAEKIIKDMTNQGIIRPRQVNLEHSSPASHSQGKVTPIKSYDRQKTEQDGRNPLFLVKGDPFGRAYDQFRIYGGKTALQISAVHDKNLKEGIDCIMLSFACVDANKEKKNGKNQFGWDKAIQFALSDVEAITIVNLVLGYHTVLHNITPVRKNGHYEYSEGVYHKAQNGSYKNLKGKYTRSGDKYTPPNSAQLTILSDQGSQNGKSQSIHVNVTISDRMRLSSFILSRLKKSSTYRGLNASEILAISREMM